MTNTILYVHSSDELYGADLILLQLLDNLDNRLYHPIVVIPTDVLYDGLLSDALRKRKIKTIYLKTAILRRKYFSLLGGWLYFYRLVTSTIHLVRIIRQEKVSLVHSNTAVVIPGALAAFWTRTPHIWHIHEIIVHPRFVWRLTSWLLPRLSKKVVAVSEQTREHLCAGNSLNEKKSIVIYNGLDLGRFREVAGQGKKVRDEWSIKPSDILVGMVGRVNNWKGQGYFLDITNLVLKKKPTARFAIVGGSFPEQMYLVTALKEKIKELNLTDSVIFSDFRSDVAAVMDAFDIFVLPSTSPDPFPTVILEAMAVGRPVVANAHGGSVEMVEHQVTGILVKPNHPEEMAGAINYLIDNPNKRREMGLSGRERLQQKFSLETFITNWHYLYKIVLAGIE